MSSYDSAGNLLVNVAIGGGGGGGSSDVAIHDNTTTANHLKVNADGSINVNPSSSSASTAIQDGTTPAQKLAVDASGKIGINNLPATQPVSGAVNIADGVTAANKATVAQFHNADAQNLPGTAYGLLTGGVAQILNPSGVLDRQRGTGVDGIAAVGVATGAQQLAGAQLSTTVGASGITGSTTAQSVLVASTANMKVGDIVTTSDNVESVEVTAIADATHCTGIFKNTHASGATLVWWHYNQARDASIGDGAPATGLSAETPMLFNGTTYDRQRAVSGDGMTATGIEAAIDLLYNGTSYDRPRTATGDALPTTGIPGEAELLWNGTAFDRAREANSDGMPVTGIGADSMMLWNGTTFDRWKESGAVSGAALTDMADRAARQLGHTVVDSGNITANAGTNLNTSALALETGGNLAAAKADLDTLVTRLPAQGQALKAASVPVVLASDQGNLPVSVQNATALGQATMAASSPVVIASNQSAVPMSLAQVLGLAMSASNPVLTQDQMRALVAAGQIFSLTGTAVSTSASNAALMLFGGASGITKNTFLFSATVYSSAGNSNLATLRSIAALDATIATQQTPTNWQRGGAASLYTGANAAVNLPTAAAPGYSGTTLRNVPAIPQNNLEVLPAGGYFIPANTANSGVELVIAQASAGLYVLNLLWAEF